MDISIPMRRSRILFFVSEDWFFCSHFIERAIAAKRAGHDVLVLTRVREHGDEIRAQEFELIPIDMVRHGINPLVELATLFRVIKVYRRFSPDLIHHFALKPIVYGSLAARLTGHRTVINAPVGMGFVFASGSRLARLLRPVMRLALRGLLNPLGSRVVFENSDDLNSAVAERLVRRGDAVLIRGAGVDVQRFFPKPESPGLPVVMLVARMLWDKGVAEFVEAARILAAQGVAARFRLVGAPDPGNPATIDASQLRQWHEEGVVEWLGKRSDVPDLMDQSHIVCLPSYREGLPKTLLEALAAGRPIVTTDVPGCREAVVPGQNGLLVPPRDADALASALALLLGDPALRHRFGIAGRRLAESEFASELVDAATMGLYCELLRQ